MSAVGTPAERPRSSDVITEPDPEDVFVLKSVLRVKIRPHSSPSVQRLVDTLTGFYDQCSAEVTQALGAALSREPLGKSPAPLYIAPGGTLGAALVTDLIKAGPSLAPPAAAAAPMGPTSIKQPGIRGGKWWRDKKGVVRYGAKPKGGEGTDLSHEEVREHLSHFSTSAVRQHHGDKALVAHLRASRSTAAPFSPEELNFLEWWHDEGIRSLVEGYSGLSLDDLFNDLNTLRLNDDADGPLSFEEAVDRFFEDQDWGDATYEEVEPVLEDLLDRYRKAAEDKGLSGAIEDREQKAANEWFRKVKSMQAELEPLASHISSGVDTELTSIRVLSALSSLDLVRALKGSGVAAAMPNDKLLSEGRQRLGMLLHSKFGQSFSSLSSVMGMLSYIGSGLNAIWEPTSGTYFTAAAVPTTKLGTIALGTLREGTGLGARVKLLKGHLDDVTLSLAKKLNKG